MSRAHAHQTHPVIGMWCVVGGHEAPCIQSGHACGHQGHFSRLKIGVVPNPAHACHQIFIALIYPVAKHFVSASCMAICVVTFPGAVGAVLTEYGYILSCGYKMGYQGEGQRAEYFFLLSERRGDYHCNTG